MTLGGMTIAIGALVDDAIIDMKKVVRCLRDNRAQAGRSAASDLRRRGASVKRTPGWRTHRRSRY